MVTTYKSKLSASSALSAFSILSVCGILSAVSLASFMSVGSIGSVLSLCSITSVLSFASLNSVLSVGSTNCYFKIFTDCRERPSSVSNVTLDFTESSWVNIKNCSFDEYKSGNRPAKCDYQSVTVTVATSMDSTTLQCEARRKGTSTWQEDPLDKPSWKVKCDQEFKWGEYDCQKQQIACPPGQTKNIWSSKKFILNNNGRVGSHHNDAAGIINTYFTWGEVDAYTLFRDIGKIAVPHAAYTKVVVSKDNTELSEHDLYVLLENNDDKNFMSKWFGEDYALYEVEDNDWDIERDKGAFDDCNKTHCTVNGVSSHVPNLAANAELIMFTHSDEAMDDMIRYYVGELLTGHWDGACLRHYTNNHYMAQNTSGWFVLPSGLDNTFQGCLAKYVSDDPPQCKWMTECMQHSNCRERYSVIYQQAKTQANRIVPSCAGELMLPVVYICVGVVGPLLIALLMLNAIDSRYQPRIDGLFR